jgi:pimeloyl-ACP methyl ester carboxylesterase
MGLRIPGSTRQGWDVPPGRRVELPDRGITFMRQLEGPTPDAPTVVLLHGLGATGALNWFSTFEPLARHFRVIAIDHRGHGRGLRSPHRFRLADCADDVAALLDALDIASAVAVGYSMGGPIAQLLWHRHPDKVDGLVLCATSRNFRGRWRERLQFAGLGLLVAGLRVAPRKVVEEVAEQLPVDLPDKHDSNWALRELRRHDVRMVLEAAEAIGRFSSREWIGGIDVPVSVVVTADDRLVPAHRQVKLAQEIPSAVIHVVEGTHLVASSDPERFAETVVEACELVARRSAKRRKRHLYSRRSSAPGPAARSAAATRAAAGT